MSTNAMRETIQHPFPPLYDGNSRILILGSFPSVKSREQRFFYGHPQNRFWRVMAGVLGCETPKDIPEKRDMLLRNGIALWDTIARCDWTARIPMFNGVDSLNVAAASAVAFWQLGKRSL